jgi:hypothetical protein
MIVHINPGSGPVSDATEAHAAINITAFLDDLAIEHDVLRPAIRHGEMDEGGRFGWTIRVDDVWFEIEMPGIPLDQVRWIDGPEQNIWNFPRLYVDGSSWVWKYALASCTRCDDE